MRFPSPGLNHILMRGKVDHHMPGIQKPHHRRLGKPPRGIREKVKKSSICLSHYCRDNGLLLHIHRAMHAIIDRQKNHGIHFTFVY